MKVRSLMFVAGIMVLAVVLAGCGGGGGAGPSAPGVSLAIGADTAVQSGRARSATLGAQLAEGATVTVYDFKTGQVIKAGTIGADGFCTLDVTPGLTVAVVAVGTGKEDLKAYRLSMIIPLVPTVDTEYVLYPETSMAAEAIAETYYAKGKVVDEDTVTTVLEAALAYAAAHPDADYSTTTGTLIAGSQFGVPGSLTDELQDVIDAVPTIDDALVAAKNAVQQIKEAGAPLALMLNQDALDLDGLFSSEVIDSYTALGTRLSKLILPVLIGGMELGGSRVSLSDLTPNHAYEVTDNMDGWLVIADMGAGTSGQITITYATVPGETPAGTYTLVAKQVGSNFELTQTFTGDASQLYKVTGPVDPTLVANPSFTGTISLRDSVLTTPLTFTGTISAVGVDKEHYTRVTFAGALTTPEVTSSGTFQVNFPSTKPAGASDDQGTYDFPTSGSMTNGRITITDGATTVAITGALTGTTQVIAHTGYANIEPHTVELSGTYANSDSGLSFSGSITGSATWAASGDGDVLSSGSVRVQGSLTRDGYPTYSDDITVTRSSSTSVTTSISLRAGASTLEGSGSATLDADGKLVSATVTLTNQASVQFTIESDASGDITGTIKVGGETEANITKEATQIRVTYKDSTFEVFPF